jgi:DNA (cytosine-5)-methyltransferase 1
MNILNLYSNIGGNRRDWKGHRVTAVEINPEIAAIYKEYFPDDEIIIGDAREYLLRHYREYDFIWTSRPCITHSRARYWTSKGGRYDPKFPDMGLYEEIIFMQHFVECKWVAENVVPYYEPLIKPTIQIGRHLFWSNFTIRPYDLEKTDVDIKYTTANNTVFGFSMKGRKINHRKDQILRNLVNPDLGLYILEQAQGVIRQEKTNQISLFDNKVA